MLSHGHFPCKTSAHHAWMVCIALAFFWPAFQADFINYDDPIYVTKNDQVTGGLTWHAFTWAMSFQSADKINLWHPVTWMSHMLDVSWFGLNPSAHHGMNVCLHLLCGGLFAVLLGLFLPRDQTMTKWWFAGALALGWTIHPCRVEVVFWVSERKEILCAILILIATLSYVTHRALVIGWLAFLLACLAKPVAIALPLALVAFPGVNLRRLLPWFGLSCLMALLTLALQQDSGHSVLNSLHSPSYRLLRMPWRAMEYVVDLLGLPGRLLFRYPPPLSSWMLLITWLWWLSWWSLAWHHRRKWPFVYTGTVWFHAFFLPVSGLIPVSIYETADRYSYLPHMGLIMILAGALFHLKPIMLATVCVSACMSWGIVTIHESSRWMNSLTLFSSELQRNPRSLLANIQYGHALLEQNRLEESLVYFEKASALDPKAAIGPINVGLLLEKLGRSSEATDAYRSAISRSAPNGTAFHRLAILLSERGDHPESLRILLEGLHQNPKDLNLLIATGQLLAQRLNRLDDAFHYYEKAWKLAPRHPDILQDMGVTLIKLGRAEEGRSFLKKAMQADPKRTYLQPYLLDSDSHDVGD